MTVFVVRKRTLRRSNRGIPPLSGKTFGNQRARRAELAPLIPARNPRASRTGVASAEQARLYKSHDAAVISGRRP